MPARNPRREPHRRTAVAAVELSVCLPLLVVIAFATIEICAMLYTQQTLKIASYEGARVGVVPEAEAANVIFQCESILDRRGVSGYEIQLDPMDPSQLSEGQYFRVTIAAAFQDNSLTGGWTFQNKILTRSTALISD